MEEEERSIPYLQGKLALLVQSTFTQARKEDESPRPEIRSKITVRHPIFDYLQDALPIEAPHWGKLTHSDFAGSNDRFNYVALIYPDWAMSFNRLKDVANAPTYITMRADTDTSIWHAQQFYNTRIILMRVAHLLADYDLDTSELERAISSIKMGDFDDSIKISAGKMGGFAFTPYEETIPRYDQRLTRRVNQLIHLRDTLYSDKEPGRALEMNTRLKKIIEHMEAKGYQMPPNCMTMDELKEGVDVYDQFYRDD